MHIPYADPSSFTDPKDLEIVERVRSRRGPSGFLDLDLALLNAPPIANGWNTFLGAIRTDTTLSQSHRETIICRIAALTGAWYEWMQHAPLLVADDPKTGEKGMSQLGLRYIFGAPRADARPVDSRGPSGMTGVRERRDHPAEITAQHILLLDVTDFLTSGQPARLPTQLIDSLKQSFDNRQFTEIMGTIAAYNCVSRFLLGMDVGEMSGVDGLEKVLKADDELGSEGADLRGGGSVWERERNEDVDWVKSERREDAANEMKRRRL